MDKETLSHYGWIVILVLILSVMLALATPFGTFVADGIKSTTAGLFDVQWRALDSAGINIDKVKFDPSNPPAPFDPTNKTEINIKINDKDYVGYAEMTWDEWLNSQYNVDAFHPYSSIVTWAQDGAEVGRDEHLVDEGEYKITELQITELQMTIKFTNNAHEPYEIIYVEGMTWSEWTNSMYNTIGATINTDNTNEAYVGVVMKEIDGVRYGLSSSEQCCADTLVKKDKTMPATGAVYYFIAETSGDAGETEPEPEVQLISFSVIRVEPYKAEVGMTWAQWVDSKYNESGFYVENGKVYVDGQTAITIQDETFDKGCVTYDGNKIMSTDAIIGGASYGLKIETPLSVGKLSNAYTSYGEIYAKETVTGQIIDGTVSNNRDIEFAYVRNGSTYELFTKDENIKVGTYAVSSTGSHSFTPASNVGGMSFNSDDVAQYGITKLVSSTTGREIIGVLNDNGSITFRATTFPDTWYIYSATKQVGTLTLDATGNGSYTLG